MKHIFTVNLELLQREVIVSAGMSHKEVLKHCKDDDTKKFIDDAKEYFTLLDKDEIGGFSSNQQGYHLIALSPFENTWDYWDKLVHEVTHLVDDTLKSISAETEPEFRAYLTHSMFRRIRTQLLKKFVKDKVLDTLLDAQNSPQCDLNSEKV